MSEKRDLKTIPLPKDWPNCVKSGVLHVISLAHLAITSARAWAANSCSTGVGIRSQVEQLQNEVELLQEEIRIKDARIASLESRHRPHYRPTERLAILMLRAVGVRFCEAGKRNIGYSG